MTIPVPTSPNHPDNDTNDLAEDDDIAELLEGLSADAPVITEEVVFPKDYFPQELPIETEKGDS